MREFEGGATRDDDSQKLSYTGFFDPTFLLQFGQYMHRHRQTANGIRGASNWKSQMPTEVYLDSLIRHVFDIWLLHTGLDVRDKSNELVDVDDALMGALFNLQGIWYNLNRDIREVNRDGIELKGDSHALRQDRSERGPVDSVGLRAALRGEEAPGHRRGDRDGSQELQTRDRGEANQKGRPWTEEGF